MNSPLTGWNDNAFKITRLYGGLFKSPRIVEKISNEARVEVCLDRPVLIEHEQFSSAKIFQPLTESMELPGISMLVLISAHEQPLLSLSKS